GDEGRPQEDRLRGTVPRRAELRPPDVGGSFPAIQVSSLFGGGPLAQLAGSLLAGILILAVIIGLAYVIYRLATKKKPAGTGTQTVVVEGGRR
ncbi:MAG: hypothetical protein ACREC5_07130, partial [Thermoplasmata archaeon]